MHREIGFGEALIQRLDQLQHVAGTAAVLGPVPGERQAQLVGQIAPGPLIEAEERPGANPVQPKGEVPGHAVELHGGIEGLPESRLGLLVVRVRQLQAQGKHVPERVDLARLPVLVVGEEPGLLVVEHRNALEALRHRFAHPQEGGQLGCDGHAAAVTDAAVEQAEQGEGVDVADEALAAIGELIAVKQIQGLMALLRLLQELNQRLAILPVGQQGIGDRLVEAGPLKAGVVRLLGAEAFTPEGIIAEAI